MSMNLSCLPRHSQQSEPTTTVLQSNGKHGRKEDVLRTTWNEGLMDFITMGVVILDLSSGNMEGRTASDWPIPAGSYPRLQQSSGNSARTGLAVLIYAGQIAPRRPRIASTVLHSQSHTSLESLPTLLGTPYSRRCFLSR
jgi:hypothetical protein